MARQARPQYGQKSGHDTAQLGCDTASSRARQEFLYHDTGFVLRQGRGSAGLGSAPVVS